METAFAWIGQIAEFFGSFFPRILIVKSSHRAVKYVYGRRRVLCRPGIHFYWPLVTEYETCAVVRQVQELGSQLLETRDEHTIMVAGVVVYEIDDALTFLADNENPYEGVRDVCSAAIRKVVILNDYARLKAGRASLDTKLAQEMQKLLSPFGVRVLYARLTDMAPVRPIHLSGGLAPGFSPHTIA